MLWNKWGSEAGKDVPRMYLPIYELLCDLPMKSWVEDVISWVLTWSDPVQFYDTTVVRDWSSVVVNYSNSHGLSRIAEIDWWEGEWEAEDPPQVDMIAKEDLFISIDRIQQKVVVN